MILLLGATGYIGSEFAAELGRRRMPFVAVSRTVTDYTRFDILLRLLKENRPTFLINAAGYTGKPNVDACETSRAETLWGNALLPATVAHACQAAEVPWAQLSTGCIYNGAKVPTKDGWIVENDLSKPSIRSLVSRDSSVLRGFNEEDPPNFSFRSPPCSFYSGSKALAEEIAAHSGCRYVWRTRLPFDNQDHCRNYLSKLQQYQRVYDNFNSISNRGDFVRACLHLLESQAAPGIYNLTNPGFVSAREVVEMIKRILRPRREFRYWSNDREFYAHAAVARRSNCVLDVSKALAAGAPLRPVREALQEALQSWRPTARTRTQ